MLVLKGEGADLLDFGRGNIPGEYPANTAPLMVYFEHDSRRLFCVHGKKALQNGDNKIHGGVIVVQHDDLIGTWRLHALEQAFLDN